MKDAQPVQGVAGEAALLHKHLANDEDVFTATICELFYRCSRGDVLSSMLERLLFCSVDAIFRLLDTSLIRDAL